MIPFAMASITIIAALVRMHQMLSFEVRKRCELVTTIGSLLLQRTSIKIIAALYVCMYVCTYVCNYVCMNVCNCYGCIYVCMLCMNVYMYDNMYV